MADFPEGFKIRPVTGRKAELQKLFGINKDNVEVEPRGWTLHNAYLAYHKDVKEFQFEESDVLVMTYPKSGTTWTQETVYTMVKNPNLDNPEAMTTLALRSPMIENDMVVDHMPRAKSIVAMFSKAYPGFDTNHGMLMHVARMAPHPRVLKTHLSFDHLSPTVRKAKVVYVIRDPRDTCISYYHHSLLFKNIDFKGTFEQFMEAFMENATWFSYWLTVGDAWKRRNDPNVHIVFYERMKKSPNEEIKKLNDFLGTNLSDEQLGKIAHYVSFEEMKKRDSHVCPAEDLSTFVNVERAKQGSSFFRKGVHGAWRDALTEEQKDRFAAWISANCPDPEIMRIIEEA